MESDHAPHTLEEKTGFPDETGKPQYMSGIPNLANWPRILTLLSTFGANNDLIEKTFHDNVAEIFGVDKLRNWEPIKYGAHVRDYAFDPYEKLKDEIMEVRD